MADSPSLMVLAPRVPAAVVPAGAVVVVAPKMLGFDAEAMDVVVAVGAAVPAGFAPPKNDGVDVPGAAAELDVVENCPSGDGAAGF